MRLAMTYFMLRPLFAILGVVAMMIPLVGGCASAPSLEGLWGGDRLQLSVGAQGGHVELDCASGTLVGAIKLSAVGTFAAVGTFDQHQPGRQRADAPPSPAARFSGDVNADAMRLLITPEGAHEPLVFNLRKGVRVKLIRCL